LRIELQYVGHSFHQNWDSSEHLLLERQLNRFCRELNKLHACARSHSPERRSADAERLAKEQYKRRLGKWRRIYDQRTQPRD
jgi:hypothetical protein